MTPPILVGVDPVHHDPDAPVLAVLIARATGAPVIAVAAYRDDAARTLSDADHVYELRGDAMARLHAVEPAFSCPVAVAPLGFAERMRGIDRVGVAFVDTEEGHEALRAAPHSPPPAARSCTPPPRSSRSRGARPGSRLRSTSALT